jgi:hypothetical protein
MPLSKTQLAINEHRTIFTKSVLDAEGYKFNVLKSAENNNKLGKGKSKIEKGRWKGYPMYYLTLEERATCPKDCHHYDTCYGNNMWRATRFKANDALMVKLEKEIKILSKAGPFVVRLHVLGDFFSVKYVKFWAKMLERHKELHIFGYTARLHGPVYKAIRSNLLVHDRVSIKFSVDHDGFNSMDSFDSIPHYFAIGEEVGIPSIVCPEQVGKSESCLTCGLCFNGITTKAIKFLTH